MNYGGLFIRVLLNYRECALLTNETSGVRKLNEWKREGNILERVKRSCRGVIMFVRMRGIGHL